MATRVLCSMIAALACVACGGGMPAQSAGSLASTQASIRAAQEVGAAGVPKAALHLQYAKEQLDEAQALLAKGKEEKAHELLRRAEADAELSVALARKERAEKEVVDAEATLKELRRQLAETEETRR